MICPSCNHRPTLLEALRRTKLRFQCQACKAELTIGRVGWLVSAGIAGPSVAFATYAARQFNSGVWSPVLTALALLVYILVAGLAAEWAVNRFATSSRTRERAV